MLAFFPDSTPPAFYCTPSFMHGACDKKLGSGVWVASYPVSTASFFFLHVGKKCTFFSNMQKKSWQWRLGTRLESRNEAM